MNTWRKLLGDRWGVQCDTEQQPGALVSVTSRAGQTKQVTIGERQNALGFVYAIVDAPRPKAQAVGDMSGIMALFDKAAQHLKHPTIVLAVPELVDPTVSVRCSTVRLSVAGDRARVPGSITVLDGERTEEGRDWFGRILRDGTYQPSQKTNGRTEVITARLRAFAADPVTGAKESARMTGKCCFCNTRLTDERSTAVGYGAICAAHFGLPWGEKLMPFDGKPYDGRPMPDGV